MSRLPLKHDRELLDKLKFDQNGLIPAVVQEAGTGAVLMVAYMNRVSLEKTLETGKTWFWSRSRGELWPKGATSGNYQLVKAITADCDCDALLIEVVQEGGGACHTGAKSCFHNDLVAAGAARPVGTWERIRQDAGPESHTDAGSGSDPALGILRELYAMVLAKKVNPGKDSYTGYLLEQGMDKILKKLGEETAEVIIAAKNGSRSEVTYELADLFYHICVLLGNMDLDPEYIVNELKRRRGKPE
ncbi:MAG: bifunctional phosphoribosyl-AMP cyclohydrolase/phosphoribosyl-ATP diphosphatase HisIE [Firmicutes bacterium]|nr:bifunctional phosphoribosyl-AMP cyclohydrolase/phosphoribosyl-ATP diphosphatase HisIE [Bacillota bacterium]